MPTAAPSLSDQLEAKRQELAEAISARDAMQLIAEKSLLGTPTDQMQSALAARHEAKLELPGYADRISYIQAEIEQLKQQQAIEPLTQQSEAARAAYQDAIARLPVLAAKLEKAAAAYDRAVAEVAAECRKINNSKVAAVQADRLLNPAPYPPPIEPQVAALGGLNSYRLIQSTPQRPLLGDWAIVNQAIV
jgi:hypothetical protein